MPTAAAAPADAAPAASDERRRIDATDERARSSSRRPPWLATDGHERTALPRSLCTRVSRLSGSCVWGESGWVGGVGEQGVLLHK